MTEGRTMAQPIRGTQKLVDQMGWVFVRPQLTGLEIAWRWIFGVPFLLICWREFQRIVTAVPPESAGLNSLDTQNPWVAVLQLGNVWSALPAARCSRPPVAGALLRRWRGWLSPAWGAASSSSALSPECASALWQ